MAPETPAPVFPSRALRAMNTDITLVCCRADGQRRLDRAERWLHAFEARFSRFLPDSELTRLNAAAGEPFRASPQLLRLVRIARDFARDSDGLFDPTILRQLEAAGYDRSFELIPLARPVDPRHAASRATWRDIIVDDRRRTIALRGDAAIDLGGIGKGWAVDRVAAILVSPCLVNCGGDVFAAGVPPDRGAWRVGVADPFAPENDLLVLAVEDRGVATSSSVKRRWMVGDRFLHHLIDPRTGGPSDSDAVQVTVVAPTAVLADYHAKVALLSGAGRGLAHLDRTAGVEGLVVASDGARYESRGFRQYVVP